MNKYFLYGAAVQGIQNFIYQSNDLNKIIEASERVDEICNGLFEAEIKNCKIELILHAAGNIKCIFSEREQCERVVKIFPKKVVAYAPGITVSQAVEPFNEGENFAKVVDKLEKKLRIQRNIPMRSQTLGYIGMKRDNYETQKKLAEKKSPNLLEKFFGEVVKSDDFDKKLVTENEKLGDNNTWVAIVHVDGNGLGQVVQKIGGDKEKFSKFSEELNKATIDSAQQTFRAMSDKWKDGEVVPIRPVILGGDDLTMICRGSIALEYAKQFIINFEEKTKAIQVLQECKINGLSACAGIAFVKASFPFASGYELAESICSYAKKISKSIDKEKAPSCIMFHKMQDSFSQDYKDIINRELKPNESVSFCYGPYFIDEGIANKNGYWSVVQLVSKADLLNQEDENNKNSAKSALRQWLSAMHNDEGSAKQLIDRAKNIISANTELKKLLGEATTCVDIEMKENDEIRKMRKYPAYDILAYHTIMNQVVDKGGEK